MMILIEKVLEVLLITMGLLGVVKGLETLEKKYQSGWFTVIIALLFGLIYVVS